MLERNPFTKKWLRCNFVALSTLFPVCLPSGSRLTKLKQQKLMLKFLTFAALIITSLTFGQNKINADNYYSYYKDYNDYVKLKVKKLETGRLTSSEIAKVLREEMKLAGFEWLNDYQIIHINNEEYITSICYSEKSKFGFVLETIFESEPNKKNRDLKSLSKESSSYDYVEKIIEINGESKFIKIKALPKNLYLIKQDIYWFQSTENVEINKTLVTKENAIVILRTDVKNILKLIKK